MNSVSKLPAAVLWDMDGTLVDTEPFWMAGETALANEHGAEWSETDALALVGSGLLEAAEYIRARIDSDLQPEAIVERLVAGVAAELSAGLPWQPGALELIEEFRDRGVPQALVTMSYRPVAQPIIDAVSFDAVVTGDLGLPAKPNPAPYLHAAELLGVDARDCWAVEDSPTGADSANAAGCFVIGVPHAVDVPPAQNRVVVSTLAGLAQALNAGQIDW